MGGAPPDTALACIVTGRTRRWRTWQHAPGASFHPRADVVTIVGLPGDLRDGWGPEQVLVEDTLAGAVAGPGGTTR